jgi:hypothetical protein
MPDSLTRLWASLLATSPMEAMAVVSGVVYVVLAVPRSRWCWVAGGFSSLTYVAVCSRAVADAVAAAGLVRRRRRVWLPHHRSAAQGLASSTEAFT